MIRFILILFVFFLIPQAANSEEKDHLIELESFKALSARVCQENKIMVIMISRENCPYCIKLKKQILIPELKNGELNNQWLLRELLIDEGKTHIGFDGETIESLFYTESINATLTPTLVFLGPDGKELGKRIVGIGGAMEFYGFYLRQSINQALDHLNCSQ
jgi:thioredoxin-related protein